MIHHFLDLILEVLLITNIWQFFYTNILKYLNVTFPPKPAGGDFIRLPAELAPEPHEIPLYIGLSISLVLFLILYHRFIQRLILDKLNINFSTSAFLIFKLLLTISLALLFLNNLGSYPLAHDIFPYDKQIYPIFYFGILLLYLLPLSIIVIESALLAKIIQSAKIIFSLFMFFLVAVILFLTFEPGFPMSTLDYSLFFGPVWEISQGKTIYTQAPSLYGFLSILVLSLFSKLKLLNLWYLPAIIWLLYTVQYLLCFWLLYKLSKSLAFSLLGLFSILTLNYFSLFHLPATIPQTGPMRWLPLIIALIFFCKIKKIDSKIFIFSIALLSFWNIDNGIALVLAYAFTLSLQFLSLQINLKKAIKAVLWLIFYLAVIFFLIQTIHFIFGYKPIDIFLTFRKITQYTRGGFGMLPMEEKTYFWLVILVYFASVIYVFNNNIKQKLNKTGGGSGIRQNADKDSKFKLFDKLRFGIWDLFGNWKLEIGNSDVIILFSANLSLFGSVYFIGRSHPHNLFHISLIFVMNVFILFAIIFRKLQTSNLKLLVYIALFLLFILLPAIQRQEVITSMIIEKYNRFKQGAIFRPVTYTALTKAYRDEIKLIRSHVKEDKILMLFDDDSYLFYLTGKGNLMDYNPQILNFTTQDFNLSLQEVLRKCPRKIVGDCRLFGRCSNITPFTQTYLYIQPLLLQKIESSCRLKYEPEICTKYLCTATGKKI